MSESKALAIIEDARAKGALVYAPQNMECPPLYKAEATVITAKPDEFFNIQGKYMPSKAVVDRIGEAAGVDFIAANCGVKTESRDDDIGKRTVFVGFAQGKTRLPDGSWRQSSIEEYEFDPLLRAQMESKNDSEVRKKYLDYAKVARQRASTGARVRVIRQLTGMPVTFSQADVAKPLVFSRIVQNTDFILSTHEGKMMAIAMATGAAQMMYGQQPQVVGPANESEINLSGEPPMRNATPATADPFGADDFADIPFGDDEPPTDPRLAAVMGALFDWSNSDDGRLAGRAKRIIDSGDTRLAVLEPALELIKYLGGFVAGDKIRGGSECVAALDMPTLDPIVLGNLAAKVRGSQQGAA